MFRSVYFGLKNSKQTAAKPQNHRTQQRFGLLNMTKPDFFKTATSLLHEKFSNAKCAFVAGSVTRGEQTETSDIDIVVIFDTYNLPKAYRSSLIYQNWPVELFIQNTNSLSYFWKQDILGGAPVLINMIAEGIVYPEKNGYALSLQKKARSALANGPEKFKDEELNADGFIG